MICYRDETFCPFYKNCEKGSGCRHALTEKVVAEAKIWWGHDDPPICEFVDHPSCFKNLDNKSGSL